MNTEYIIQPVEFDKMLKWAEVQLDDRHSRYHSWEHAFRQWLRYASDTGQGEADLMALHLAFYLASWGMLRGSSQLLQRDYKALTPIVKLLKRHRGEGWQDCMFHAKPGHGAEDLASAIATLNNELITAIETIPPAPGERIVSATDTLTSKILLNTLACVPAWDWNVKRALRSINGFKAKGTHGFGLRFLQEFIEFARKNQRLIERGQKRLHEVHGFKFPLTRILDLYLWYMGS